MYLHFKYPGNSHKARLRSPVLTFVIPNTEKKYECISRIKVMKNYCDTNLYVSTNVLFNKVICRLHVSANK